MQWLMLKRGSRRRAGGGKCGRKREEWSCVTSGREVPLEADWTLSGTGGGHYSQSAVRQVY